MPRLDLYANFKLFVKLKLPEKDVLIGRAGDCDIQLADEAVSRHHVRIVRDGDGYAIHNLSPNGTRVNASMVTEPRALEAGDRIYVENAVFIYQPDEAVPEDLDKRRTVLKNPVLRRPVT